MSERSEQLLLEDIVDAARKIQKYTRGMSFDDFFSDDKTVDAVVRNFEIIGEASNRLSEQFKAENKGIDWSRIRGFRNRIVHDYFGIDHSIVWNIIEHYLPHLSNELKKLSKKSDEE